MQFSDRFTAPCERPAEKLPLLGIWKLVQSWSRLILEPFSSAIIHELHTVSVSTLMTRCVRLETVLTGRRSSAVANSGLPIEEIESMVHAPVTVITVHNNEWPVEISGRRWISDASIVSAAVRRLFHIGRSAISVMASSIPLQLN